MRLWLLHMKTHTPPHLSPLPMGWLDGDYVGHRSLLLGRDVSWCGLIPPVVEGWLGDTGYFKEVKDVLWCGLIPPVGEG